MQRLRESLALFFIALLPFHAFLVTVKTRFLLGPGQAPMGEIAAWKEAVLALILLAAVIEIVLRIQNSAFRIRFDVLDAIISALLVLGVVVSLINSQFSILPFGPEGLRASNGNSQFLYGFRYDFIPLLSFLLLRRVPWSDVFLKRAMKVLLTAGVVVAAYGILSFFLPQSFFTWLGYSDLHSLYLPGGPIAPFQQIGGTAIRRIQSVMSGPNQLGLWLLVPIAIATSYELRATSKKQYVARSSQLFVLVAALVLSFSRAAWIGAAIIICMALWPTVRSLSRRIVVPLVSCVLCLLVVIVFAFPSIILRAASSRGHIENPLRAIQTMVEHPLGLGLGIAGPASNRTSDACVMLEEGSDASWAVDRPELCVFVGQSQVQPLDRACNCPFLPENWYLQIGVEMGWVGMILYIVLTFIVLQRLWKFRIQNSEFSIFLAISIAALFLHAWEDSALAYTVWVLIASQLPTSPGRK